MRAQPLFLIVSLLVLVASFPLAQAAPEPTFFETIVVEDKDADYAPLPNEAALDLVAVHLAEKYAYDADKQEGQDTLSFRFQTRDITGIPCGSEIRYDLNFKVDGTAKNLYATYTTESPTNTNNACARRAGAGSAVVSIKEPQHSILLTVPRDVIPAPVGSVLTGFVASTSLITPAQTVAQDMAPYDNQNQPSSTPPTTGLKSYTTVGTYPFLSVVPTTPTETYSVGGSEVEYNFQFFSHTELKDDNIRVRFQYPSGWSISPSQGRTGADPEGQLTGGNGGVPREFSFSLSSSGAASEGDQVSVVMEVITESGGHVLVPTVTTISGTKIEDPAVNFTLLTPGPFTAEETSLVRLTVANDLGPLQGVTLSVDLFKDGKRISTTPLVAATGGAYQGAVRFPSEGTYTVDAYISSLKPSPHHEFVVKAEKGGLAPGVPAWSLLLLVGALVVLRRRA